MNLSNEDVQDILSMLETLPYGEFVLETSRFTLRLRRGQDGVWAQEHNVLTEPALASPAAGEPAASGPAGGANSPAGTASAPAGMANPAPAAAGPAGPPGAAGQAAPAAAASVRGTASSAAPTLAGTPRASPPPASPPAASPPAEGPRGGPAAGLLAVRTPLPGTFYRAPSPGAPPYVEVGGDVGEDTVVAIIETMKLMNPVYAGTAGTVAEICLADGEFAPQDTVLMRVSTRAG